MGSAAEDAATLGAYSGDFVLTDEVIRSTESAFYAPGASALNRAWYAPSWLCLALREGCPRKIALGVKDEARAKSKLKLALA